MCVYGFNNWKNNVTNRDIAPEKDNSVIIFLFYVYLMFYRMAKWSVNKEALQISKDVETNISVLLSLCSGWLHWLVRGLSEVPGVTRRAGEDKVCSVLRLYQSQLHPGTEHWT